MAGESGVQHVERRLAAQRVAAGHQQLFQPGHPADARGGRDVVTECGGLPGAEAAHGPADGGDPAGVHPVEPREEGGGALVLAGVQSGEGGAQLVEGARERLLVLVRERAAFAPAEGVEAEHDMAAAGEFVAGEAAVEVEPGPLLGGGEPGVVVPGADALLLADVEAGAVVVEQQHGGEGSGAVRG